MCASHGHGARCDSQPGIAPTRARMLLASSRETGPVGTMQAGQATIRNYVTVTVTYQWYPEFLLVGPITLTSTSTMPMTY